MLGLRFSLGLPFSIGMALNCTFRGLFYTLHVYQTNGGLKTSFTEYSLLVS